MLKLQRENGYPGKDTRNRARDCKNTKEQRYTLFNIFVMRGEDQKKYSSGTRKFEVSTCRPTDCAACIILCWA